MGKEVPTPFEFRILEDTLLHQVESPATPTEHSLVPECEEGRRYTFLLMFRHCWMPQGTATNLGHRTGGVGSHGRHWSEFLENRRNQTGAATRM